MQGKKELQCRLTKNVRNMNHEAEQMFAQLQRDNSVNVHHVLSYIKLLFNLNAVNSVHRMLAEAEGVLYNSRVHFLKADDQGFGVAYVSIFGCHRLPCER